MSNLCSPERAPRYRLHKCTGQAVVTIEGKEACLGQHRSAAGHEACRRIVTNWMQNGGRIPTSQHEATVTEQALRQDSGQAFWIFGAIRFFVP